MYLAYFGKKLINAINERDGTTLTVHQFFDDIYYPLFFREDRYLYNANNSPVDQAYKFKTKHPLTNEILEKAKIAIHNKISNGDRDASIFMGGAATDPTASTSGQVNTIQYQITPEEVLCSWIGAALGVTVEGGWTLLLDENDILLALYDGWYVYRQMLIDIPTLKGNQINTWNGQWLSYRLGKQWNPQVPPPVNTDFSHTALKTTSWISSIFALCWQFHKEDQKKLTAYVYSFDQMNHTAGFVRLNLPQVRYMIDLHEKLFSGSKDYYVNNLELIYQTEMGFIEAFQQGEIGLRAIEPKNLRPYLKGKKAYSISLTDITKKNHLTIYKIWIIAMLKNDELMKKAEQLAQLLRAYESNNPRAKATQSVNVKNLLMQRTLRGFADHMIAITSDISSDTERAMLLQIARDTAKLPSDQVSLFVTLAHLEYTCLPKKNTNTLTSSFNIAEEEN